MRRRIGVLTLAVAVAGGLGACRDDGGPTGDLQAFCDAVEALGAEVTAALEPPEDRSELPGARDTAARIAERARTVADVAPEEVRDDARRLVDLTIELAEELEEFYAQVVDDPELANDPDFLTGFQPLTEDRQAELAEAGAALRPWLDERCRPASERTNG